MARLWARTVSFESVALGDQLPILVKWETKESIGRFDRPASSAADRDPATDPDPTLAPAGLLAYITELLEKAFPFESVMARESYIDLTPLAPVQPEDTISLSGQVTDKREDPGHRLVECEIVIENQEGRIVGRAVAVVPL
jgi:hypothetical protein